MRPLVVLMYHALYSGVAEREAIDPADRPYAVSVDAFERQLDILADAGIAVIDPSALPGAIEDGGVVLTFDDGHRSNYLHAMGVLSRRGLRAAFFVTTDFIANRPGFCNWQDLREMAEYGMLIGSHGCTHRFLDDLTDTEFIGELRRSKGAIEANISQVVDQVSFPGGRFRTEQLELAGRLGYRVFHSSRLGVHRPGRVTPGSVLSRIPVRQTTSPDEFGAWARGDWRRIVRSQMAAGAKHLMRKTLGNRLYHGLYERLTNR
jgi:peptidoglycan/xylan/chitin deacetylase (PgdA/CDA1 family)